MTDQPPTGPGVHWDSDEWGRVKDWDDIDDLQLPDNPEEPTP